MYLQRLNPATDEAIYRALWEMNQDVPEWYRASEECWGSDSWDEFYSRANRDDLIDCAVYSDDHTLQGSITVIQRVGKIWETFIVGRRKGDALAITQGCFAMARQLFEDGISDAFLSWVCAKHHGAIALNKACGMQETGLTLIKGKSHGKPLYWRQYVLTKDRMQEITDVKEENNANLTVNAG